MKAPRLQRLIRSSGYFRQKTRRLKDFSRRLSAGRRPLRTWLGGPLETVRAELLGTRGIGPETADSMLLYAGARPVFVVDAYTRRIGGRIGWLRPSWDYERVRAFFEGELPRSVPVYQEAHALFVALAKAHCRTKPVCEDCPLRSGCREGGRRPSK